MPSDHKATIIDGKAIAQTIRSQIADEVRQLSQKYGKVPGLALVIVGNGKDSQSYVGKKRKACAEVGIQSFDVDLPEEVPESELISKGCLELLSRSGKSIKGKKAVVVGRSNIVGLPVSLMLLKADATVSIVHSRTPDPERLIREADIIIAAAGQAMMIRELVFNSSVWGFIFYVR
ncbi:hypothetical protein CRYUN_Cryun20dG0064300 [Craigia yunnanensis]